MSDQQFIEKNKEDIGSKYQKSVNHKRKYIYGIIIFSILLIVALIVFYPFGVSIDLTDGEKIALEYNNVYTEPGFKATYDHEDISAYIAVSGEVDPSKLGTYTITYSYKTAGKITKKVKRHVEVVDTTPAQINLMGGSRVIAILNGEYKEYGYTAVDNYDGDIAANVIISSNVDITKEGIYEITYKVTDSNKNLSTVVRTVEVTSRNPLLAPIDQFSLDGFFPNATLQETADGGIAYIKDTIFIGDSITGNMGYFGFVPMESIWTRSMLTPESVWDLKVNVYHGPSYGTILSNINVYKPKRIVIAIGVSGSGWMEPEYFVLKYSQFIGEIKRLSPDTQIIIESILPIDKRHDIEEGGFSNQKINILNYYIGQMCEELGVKFLNVAPVMKDTNGQAAAGYTYGNDGIHPTDAAYEKILIFIRKHQYQ